jgi:hypothetical protein
MPPAPECPFSANYMVYVKLIPGRTEAGKERCVVECFRILKPVEGAARKALFKALANNAPIPPNLDADWPAGAGFAYEGESQKPMIYMPSQCYLIFHLDPDGDWSFSKTEPAVQDVYDEGDANAALQHIEADGSEVTEPNGSHVAYFSVVRRGANDMRPMLLYITPGTKFSSGIIDPDGGNNGGSPYPPQQ